MTQRLQPQYARHSARYLSLFCAANHIPQSVFQYHAWLFRNMRKHLRFRRFSRFFNPMMTPLKLHYVHHSRPHLSLFWPANHIPRSVFQHHRWLLRNMQKRLRFSQFSRFFKPLTQVLKIHLGRCVGAYLSLIDVANRMLPSIFL